MIAKVVHCKNEPYDIYIGRGSKWGNPYTHLKTDTLADYVVGTREEAIEKYREYILNSPSLLKDLPELDGKILGCYCFPKKCHGDILIQLIEWQKLGLI